MKIHLLVSADMEPVPPEIKILDDYGFVQIMTTKPDMNICHEGKHITVEGKEQDFIDWLGGFDGVWVGKGMPSMQEFDVMHIRKR